MDNIKIANTKYGQFAYLGNEEYIGHSLSQGRSWEESLVECVKPYVTGKVVLDIGAHIGTHTVPYAKHAKQVYSFEPQEAIFKLLTFNIKANGLENVTLFNNCVGHENRLCNISSKFNDSTSCGKPINYRSDIPANYGGVQLGEGGQETQMIAIDDLQLDKVDYMKVDVEGAENLVFYGARQTISRCLPTILYERNYKTITDEMIKNLKLRDHVCDFSILDYCRKLGDFCVQKMENDNYLLTFDHHSSWLESMKNASLSCQGHDIALRVSNEGNYQVDIPDRGIWRLISLPDNGKKRIRMIQDEQFIDGNYYHEGIVWDNCVIWGIE